MSDPRNKMFRAGELMGTVYMFDRAGDELHTHVHETEETNHITIIMDGSFECRGNSRIEGKKLLKGHVVTWPLGQAHGFVALEDGSRMLQIRTMSSTTWEKLANVAAMR